MQFGIVYGLVLQDERKKRVGGYILGRTLGEGSFAKVRQGVHVATNEKVKALRFVKKSLQLSIVQAFFKFICLVQF